MLTLDAKVRFCQSHTKQGMAYDGIVWHRLDHDLMTYASLSRS